MRPLSRAPKQRGSRCEVFVEAIWRCGISRSWFGGFAQNDLAVRGAARKTFLGAIGPHDGDGFIGGIRAKADVGSWIGRRKVTKTGLDQPPPTSAARLNDDFGAESIASAVLRINHAHGQPVAFLCNDIAKQLRRAAGVQDEKITVAVVIEITNG